MIEWLGRAAERLAATRVGAGLFITFFSPLDRVMLRLSKGRLGSGLTRPVLLLTTTGSRTGRARTVPLLYFADGDRLVLVASNGGRPRHPGWYLNLRARPAPIVEIGGRRSTYEAREAQGDERAVLWRLAAKAYPGYDIYQSRAGRQIPVVILTPKMAAPN